MMWFHVKKMFNHQGEITEIYFQKFRENNGFNRELISRNISSVRSVNHSVPKKQILKVSRLKTGKNYDLVNFEGLKLHRKPLVI